MERLSLFGDIQPELLTHLQHARWARRTQLVGETVTVETALSRVELQAALHAFSDSELTLETMTPTLEMVFTELTEEAERPLVPNDNSLTS
jgi:hypothetical protein